MSRLRVTHKPVSDPKARQAYELAQDLAGAYNRANAKGAADRDTLVSAVGILLAQVFVDAGCGDADMLPKHILYHQLPEVALRNMPALRKAREGGK